MYLNIQTQTLKLRLQNTGPSLSGWRPTYLDKSENMPDFRNVWGGVLNGEAGGGLGCCVGSLFVACEEVHDIIGQHRTKPLLLFQELEKDDVEIIGGKGKRGRFECLKMSEITEIHHSLPILSCPFEEKDSPPLPSSFWVFAESTLQSSLIPLPLHHFLLSSLCPHDPSSSLCVGRTDGWIRMSDRKQVFSWHRRFLFPLHVSLELRFILYSSQSAQEPFPPFLFQNYVMWRGETKTGVVKSHVRVFRDHPLFIIALKQWDESCLQRSALREEVHKIDIIFHATGHN